MYREPAALSKNLALNSRLFTKLSKHFNDLSTPNIKDCTFQNIQLVEGWLVSNSERFEESNLASHLSKKRVVIWICRQMKDCLQEMRSFCKVIVDVVDKRYISSTSDVANTLSCFHIPDICLGPLLFIIYLSDFERCLEYSRANMYADDTEITISSNNQVELIETAQAELLNISEWMRINKLSLNPIKTGYMIIDHPRRRKIGESLPQLFINGEKNQTG